MRSRMMIFVLAALLAITLTGCDGDDGTGPDGLAAQSISLISGNDQTAETGAALAAPFVVRVSDALNRSVANVTVNWAVTAGGGSLSATSTPTGTDGRASVTLTLGPNAGPNTVSASVSGLSGSPVVFTAIAEIALGSIAGSVVDQFDEGIADLVVHLREPGASTDVATESTDALGDFAFADIAVGDYEVLLDVPSGLTLNGQANPLPVTVTGGGTALAEFAIRQVLPVVAAADLGSSSDIPTTVTDLGSVTIEAPTSGSVRLMVSGHAIFFGDETIAEVGLSSTGTDLDLHFTRVGRHDGSGTLRYVSSFDDQIVVSVAAGSHTFHATALKESVFDTNIVTLDGLYLIAVFFPEN